MKELTYSEETKTLRVMPENYMIANFEKHYWVIDPDGAIPTEMAVAVFKFLNHIDNKFQVDSWKKMDFKALLEPTVVEVDLEALKREMETTYSYNHATDEEDCWTNTVMDALQELTGLEENLREMFKKEGK